MDTEKTRRELRERLGEESNRGERKDKGSDPANALGSSESENDDDFPADLVKLAAALDVVTVQASEFCYDWCGKKTSSEKYNKTAALGTTTTNLSTSESLLAESNMQEPLANDTFTSDGKTSRDPELVRLVIASQISAGCSSEDEGVAEMHETPPEPILTINPTSDALPSPLNSHAAASLVATKTPSDDSNAMSDSNSATTAVSNILSLPPFDPYAPQLKVQLIIKQIVSLAQLKQRIVDSSKGAISKNGPMAECERLAEMEFANIHVKHGLEEFFTFCSCKDCLEYREIVVHLMVDQFKAQHMVVMLVDALIKAYSPMLKNATAYNKFEKLLDGNKEIYWMTCGYIYNKMAEHMYFIYDESLSDNMILVLFSAILLVNNPLLLLQILSFQVECIVKAYAEGFLEIVDPDNSKIPAEEMLKYILDGYDDLCRISEHISCYLFAFENDFLRKFSLTWTLLCQRLYQQHVYLNLTDTMLACIITLKEDELTSRHAALIKKYILFDDKMFYTDKRWNDIWMELNKFNLSDVERKRRSCLLDVHRIFETVVQDALELSLRESTDDNDNDFYDFQTLENRQLAWQNIMAYMKMKWPDGFFDPPNNFVCDDKCKSCNVLLEYHADSCKCITCSIAGGPLPPKRNPGRTCYKCLALLLVEKEVTFYESKILNVCASDDFLSFIKNNEKRKSTTLDELGDEVSSTLSSEHKCNAEEQESNGTYHLAWAVFRHLNNRKRYKYSSIEEKYFCSKCEFQACRLARKILNNEIAFALSLHLVRYYQPLSMSREELRSILPNIVLYNRKMVSSNVGLDLNDVHDLVVKIYWTFVISVYATYFIEFDNDSQLSLEYFELINNDISLQTENIIGNKDDTKFVQFLDKIKSLSNEKDDLESEMENSEEQLDEIQKKLEEILTINENKPNQPLLEYTPPLESNVPTPTVSADSCIKKNCRDKSKKCCFDHSDLGDHCKENHSSKKRIKKECNHARMNETRDRLRKKLSQLVNARKNMKTTVDHQAHQTKITQPPSLKTAATAAASSSSLKVTDADSLECLNTLCKRISHLNTGKSNTPEAEHLNTQKKLNLYSSSSKAQANNSVVKESCTNNTTKSNSQERDKSTGSSGRNARESVSTATKKTGNGLDMVNEIYELLGTYSKDQSKVKKWINDTLSYIEGSSGNGNGKQQPQPTNAKKAAKKAKQKQRKEEEKRVAELQDLRSQFHDIYFKEFFDKHELKELKTSKKRDKKKITEIEANIKNLQRAKAKVETAILELIATVKQTNSEFRFSYLPTKEQQQEKLNRADTDKNTTLNLPTTNETIKQEFLISSLQTANIATGSYSLPYAHANNFPYHIDLQSPVIGSPSTFSMIRPPLPTPMCYAPPQHQQLSPEVVAAMAANVACNSTNDPSKRIVTIRRVNLPNVPEPQVTVTAKGSSPDKDKLLYTFVNGQLVQTGASMPPITQLHGNPLSMQMQGNNVPPNKPVTIPPQPLSKSQLKKERRRLAQKAAEEAEAALQVERQKLREKELELQKRREEEASMKMSKKKTKSKANDKQQQQLKKDLRPGNSSTKSNKKAAVMSSPSTTSVSTADAADFGASNSSTTSTRRRSSSEISGSALQSSHTSLSSQMNTRDNSICSQNPALKTNLKKGGKTKQNPQSRKQEKCVKELNQKKSIKKAIIPPPSPPPPVAPAESAQSECEDISTPKRRKVKRNKFIDNGQFDNNPFKSLHMMDLSSDSEYSSYDEDDAESVVESIDKKANNCKEVPVKQPTLNKVLKTKKDEVKETQEKKQTSSKVSNSSDAKPQRNEKDTRDKHDNTICQAKSGSQNPQILQTNNKKAHSLDPPVVTKKPLVPPPAQAKPQPQEQRNKLMNRQAQQPVSKRNPATAAPRFERPSNPRSIPPTTNLSTNTPNTARNNNRSNTRNMPVEQQSKTVDPKPLSKRAQKQAQRNKHKSQKPTNHSNNDDCYSGIPNNMGYFNSSDFNIPSPQIKQQQNQLQHLKQTHQQQYKAMQQQMQSLYLNSQQPSSIPSGNNYLTSASDPRHSDETSTSNHNSSASNVSIMDQLNRGVQVENLSLPPGITLTKVDPIKSEMLRKKSESIKKLAKPLQQQSHTLPQSFHHPGATIIAPPVASVSGYYGAPYAGVAAAAALGQNGVIMLETMPPGNAQQVMLSKPNVAAAAAAASNTKSSKSKKRRNKSKNVISSRNVENSALPTASTSSGQPKMVTLRNPMFHSGPPGAAAPIIQQPPCVIPGRPVGGLPLAAALPMDQPAAIIKNENGMFTIRNPALQQAVASGLAMGGYRQFGNVNYYTPQEAVAEAARATQNASKTSNDNATFSYFSNSSNEQIPQGAVNDRCAGVQPAHDLPRETHNNISISCTRVEGNNGLVAESAVIARPSQPTTKCISAIGSEIKNAQQQKQKSKETQWTNFGPEMANNTSSTDSLACGSSFLSGSARSAISNSPMQEKYQHSIYYNGFDVFPANSNSSQISSTGGRSSNTGSLFDSADCHMNHNCGDESPPPTITGFNHYLEGIPNTGVIRYDDASFLKTLMPGQHLNNEISIHNVNDSNFTRNSTSPVAHRVEISPVYGNRPTSENIYEHRSTAVTNTSTNYRESLNEYSNEANLFAPNTLLNLNEMNSDDRDVESFKRFNYNFNPPKEKQKVNININDLLLHKNSASNRASPYMDENALESFVQNMNTLQISTPTSTETDEQCSQLNSGGASINGCNNNGWW